MQEKLNRKQKEELFWIEEHRPFIEKYMDFGFESKECNLTNFLLDKILKELKQKK